MRVCLDDLWLILYVLLCAYKINACLSLSLSSAGLASQMPFAAPFGKGCKMEEVMVISCYDNSVQRYMWFSPTITIKNGGHKTNHTLYINLYNVNIEWGHNGNLLY